METTVEQNVKFSGRKIKNPTIDLLYHSKTNAFYVIEHVYKNNKGIFIKARDLYLTGIFSNYKKFKFEEVTILNSTSYKDYFNHEIYEDSLIRDITNDEYGVVRFGSYEDFDDKNIIHEGFYIEWENPNKRKEFVYWIQEGIQLVDLIDRRPKINIYNGNEDVVTAEEPKE